MENPLRSDDARALPRFDRVEPQHVEPAVRALLAELARELASLEKSAAPTWSGVVEPLERIGDRLGTPWGVVGHLLGVRNSPALRTAHEAVQPDVVRFGLRVAQSKPIFDALVALEKSPDYARLDPAQKRIVALLIRDAKLAGIGLEGAALARFQAIATELAEHQTAFSNHVLDATKAFSLVLRDPAEVAGLPASALDLAAQSARAAGEANATAEHGPWRLTLDQPSLVPALQHLRRRDLREQLYRANVARASAGKEDNTALIANILRLRREEARLLGFATFAELSLASKMAPDVGAVRRLLEELRAVSYAAAERELAELRVFARAHGETAELTHWDIAFWAERQREERYAFSRGRAAPVLPAPRGADGPVRAGRAAVRRPDPRGRRRGAGLARRRPLLPGRRRPGPAARGVLPRSLLAARREARRRLDGRVSGPEPPLRRRARPRAPAGRAPGLQPDAAGGRQAVADDASTRSRRSSTSSATACSTC